MLVYLYSVPKHLFPSPLASHHLHLAPLRQPRLAAAACNLATPYSALLGLRIRYRQASDVTAHGVGRVSLLSHTF
jgi:hypothetical protein